MGNYVCGRGVCDHDTDTVTRSVTGLGLDVVRLVYAHSMITLNLLSQSPRPRTVHNYFHHSKFRNHSC